MSAKKNKRTIALIKELLSKKTVISNLVEQFDVYKKLIDPESFENGVVFPCYVWKENSKTHVINTCDGIGKTIPDEAVYINDLKEFDEFLGV